MSSTIDPSRPVTRWADVALVLGVSYDTVWRRRRQAGSHKRLPFRNVDAVWAWWDSLGEEPAPTDPAPAIPKTPRGPRVLDGPLDARAWRQRLRDPKR